MHEVHQFLIECSDIPLISAPIKFLKSKLRTSTDSKDSSSDKSEAKFVANNFKVIPKGYPKEERGIQMRTGSDRLRGKGGGWR